MRTTFSPRTASAVLLGPVELFLSFRCSPTVRSFVFWARDFCIRTPAKQCSGPTGRMAFFPPSRSYHPSPVMYVTTTPSVHSPANLITRAFVLKGPLSRPRIVVFRALCVSP
ncbi:hypothetical protein ACI65C_012380 [Semiaphis heraclei]